MGRSEKCKKWLDTLSGPAKDRFCPVGAVYALAHAEGGQIGPLGKNDRNGPRLQN